MLHPRHPIRQQQTKAFIDHANEKEAHSQHHITFKNSSDERKVSAHALFVIDMLITKALIGHIQITSTVRNTNEQVDAMYPKLKNKKLDSYAAPGKSVQAIGLMGIATNKLPGVPHSDTASIKQSMAGRINDVGLNNVTKHAQGADHDTVDLSYKKLSLEEQNRFVMQAKNFVALGILTGFGWPGGPTGGGKLFRDSDCFHLDIPRPRGNMNDAPQKDGNIPA